MLRLRICPNCQEEIRSPKVYFCHRCGADLPKADSQPAVEEFVQTEVKIGIKEEHKRRSVPKLLIVITAVGLVVAAGVGVYYFYSKKTVLPSLPAGRKAPKNEALVTDVSFEVPNHPFSARGLSEIVPADVDLYLESVDPEILLPSLVSSEDWEEVRAFFDEQVGLSPTEAASFLEDEFAVIQESTASAFLSRTKDADFATQKIEEVGSYNGWRAKMINGFLVVSDSEELIHAIEEAQKKLTLNLSLTSGFAEARKKLPQTGQIFYFRQTRPSGEKTDTPGSGRHYGKKRLEFIPESLKGDAFVISKKDSGMLITGL